MYVLRRADRGHGPVRRDLILTDSTLAAGSREIGGHLCRQDPERILEPEDAATHGRDFVTAEHARLLALGTAATTAVLSLALFTIKVIRWRRAHRRAMRRALYIGAIGEMIARGVKADDIEVWADDWTFVEVIVEYIQVVGGDERERLEEIIRLADLRPRLADRMITRSSSRRLRAAAALEVMADRSIEWVLLRGLRDPLPEIRIQCASGLSSIGAMSAIPGLIGLLERDEPWVAARVADQLVQYGPEAVPLLIDTLRRGTADGGLEPSTTQLVVRVLGIIGDLRSCPMLRHLLTHPVPDIRLAAASALGRAGTMDAVEPLILALEDPDWRVKARSAAALATFSDPGAVEPLARALDEDSWWVRQNAAEALREMPGGLEALVDAIETGTERAREASVVQLGLSGTIRAARDREERQEATPIETRLVGLLDGLIASERRAS